MTDREFEWCTDCKEYDTEKHCCPRWTKVIRQTVEELKADGYAPVRQGRWILYNYPASECAYCSVCKEQYDQSDLYLGGNEYPRYCPNCGARMDRDGTD